MSENTIAQLDPAKRPEEPVKRKFNRDFVDVSRPTAGAFNRGFEAALAGIPKPKPASSGTFYRAGYEELTPQDFIDPCWGFKFKSHHRGSCVVCDDAYAKYESWRLKQISVSDASAPLTYPQAVEVLRNLVAASGGPGTRSFSYEGEWRSPEFALRALEVVLKGE